MGQSPVISLRLDGEVEDDEIGSGRGAHANYSLELSRKESELVLKVFGSFENVMQDLQKIVSKSSITMQLPGAQT